MELALIGKRGQGVGRNVITGLVVMIVMLLIATILVTEFYEATEVEENIEGENLKTVVGDKIPTVFKLLAILLIVVVAGVMLRALGVF